MTNYRLKELRLEYHLSQKEVAKALNITQQHYSNLEKGTTDLKAEHLLALSALYRINIDYIVRGTNVRINAK